MHCVIASRIFSQHSPTFSLDYNTETHPDLSPARNSSYPSNKENYRLCFNLKLCKDDEFLKITFTELDEHNFCIYKILNLSWNFTIFAIIIRNRFIRVMLLYFIYKLLS